MESRRNFLKLAGISAFSAGVSPIISRAGITANKVHAPASFNIAIAGYSFLAYKNDVDKAIEVCKAVGVKYVSLKDYQLPLNSTQEHTDEIISKFKDAGITVYGLGVIYMKSELEIDNAFAYAKRAGVNMIIAAPEYELLPHLEKKAKEYQIKIAIHNHGPEDKLFPDVDSVYNKIKDMDPLLGICLDIGHTFRCGHDPAAMLLRYHSRIYDMHLKDVDEATIKGKTVINGMGKINFVSLIKAIQKSGYSGMCSLEYEQKVDPAMGIAQSIGHFRGVLTCAR
jgi:inosose dehydratase